MSWTSRPKTIGELKQCIKDHNLPDDCKIYFEYLDEANNNLIRNELEFNIDATKTKLRGVFFTQNIQGKFPWENFVYSQEDLK